MSRPKTATPGGARRRASTATSSFGVSRREGHDASVYYTSRLNEGLVSSRDVGAAEAFPDEHANTVLCGDSRTSAAADNCVHLVVTSPPYNASKDYDEDLSLKEYLTLLHDVFAECYRVLTPGGRMVVNVANLGRKPYIPLSSHINIIMAEIGFLMREIIWDKSASAGSSCAWGPSSRPPTPAFETFTNTSSYSPRAITNCLAARTSVRKAAWIPSLATISFSTRSPSGPSLPNEPPPNHPAPFPVELPKRCIEMYSFTGDVVLDPFNGSGTTCVAAKMHGRRYLGVDLSEDYCTIAEERLSQTQALDLDDIVV